MNKRRKYRLCFTSFETNFCVLLDWLSLVFSNQTVFENNIEFDYSIDQHSNLNLVSFFSLLRPCKYENKLELITELSCLGRKKKTVRRFHCKNIAQHSVLSATQYPVVNIIQVIHSDLARYYTYRILYLILV